jgi:hypothetical protein
MAAACWKQYRVEAQPRIQRAMGLAAEIGQQRGLVVVMKVSTGFHRPSARNTRHMPALQHSSGVRVSVNEVL